MRAIMAGLIALAWSIAALAQQVGMASFYGEPHHGRMQASGIIFDKRAFTAASWDYPFGTWVRVTRIKTGGSVIVRIMDRGPAKWTGRVIDLSEAAGNALQFQQSGVTKVRIEVIRHGFRRIHKRHRLLSHLHQPQWEADAGISNGKAASVFRAAAIADSSIPVVQVVRWNSTGMGDLRIPDLPETLSMASSTDTWRVASPHRVLDRGAPK